MLAENTVLNAVPSWAVVVGLAVLIAICGEMGFHVGKRAKASLGESPFGVLQAAVFGLLALLLAFSFSVGLARFDARRVAVVDEADSIRAAILRSQLLEPHTASLMQGYLQRYVDARIAFANSRTGDPARSGAVDQSELLQTKMWRLAAAQAGPHGNYTLAQLFFMDALNAAFARSSEEDAIFGAHVPDAVIIVLVVVIAFGSILLGIGFGRTERRGILAIFFFAITLSLIVATIVDLDRPRRGFIHVSLQPLQRLRTTFVDREPPASNGTQ